jgi:hypothetical protein
MCDTMLLRAFPKILVWSALIVWFSFIYLFLQYDATRPTTPQPSQGRIYSSNNHGHVTYLNEQETNYLRELQIGAFSLFVLGALIGYFQSNPRQIKEVRSAAMRAVYAIFSPASWWASAVGARRHLASIRVGSVTAALAGRKRVWLYCNGSVSDCRTRLTGSVGFNTVGPVIGDVSGNRFHLYVIGKDFRNSFAPQFHGKLTAATSGTVIEGKFRMHFFVRIFLTIWFTGVIVIGGRMASFSINSFLAGRPTANTYVGLFFPPLLLLSGLFMVYWCKTLGTNDEAQIVTFLRNTLSARP